MVNFVGTLIDGNTVQMMYILFKLKTFSNLRKD